MALKDSFRPLDLWKRVLAQIERRRLIAAAGVAVVAAVALVAGLLVGRPGDGGPRSVPEAGRGEPRERVSFLAKIVPPAPERPERVRGPRVPRSLADLARRLPLERKVAQLFLVGFQGETLTAPVFQQLRRLDFGGIVIDRANYTGPQLLGALAGEAVVISQQERHVPPWVMAAQEGGELNAFPDLPPVRSAADLPSAEDAADEAGQAAATLKPLGVTGLLAPSIDVGLVDEPALGPRVYSDDTREVVTYARAVTEAYRRGRVFSAVKYFPGLGSASQSTEEGPASVGLSLEELRTRDLLPFRAAFRAGAPGVVLGHGLYPIDDFAAPASLSRRIATDLLRRELRFRGLAITDDLADPAITAVESVPEASVRALKAGADMLFISGPSGDQQAAYVAVLRAVRTKEVSRRRLDEALLRILSAKRRYGVIR
jgi:beta-N-acetylhexosaminidase